MGFPGKYFRMQSITPSINSRPSPWPRWLAAVTTRPKETPPSAGYTRAYATIASPSLMKNMASDEVDVVGVLDDLGLGHDEDGRPEPVNLKEFSGG